MFPGAYWVYVRQSLGFLQMQSPKDCFLCIGRRSGDCELGYTENRKIWYSYRKYCVKESENVRGR